MIWTDEELDTLQTMLAPWRERYPQFIFTIECDAPDEGLYLISASTLGIDLFRIQGHANDDGMCFDQEPADGVPGHRFGVHSILGKFPSQVGAELLNLANVDDQQGVEKRLLKMRHADAAADMIDLIMEKVTTTLHGYWHP